MLKHIPNQKDPFEDAHAWYALIDWEVGDKSMGQTIAETTLSRALEEGLIQDAVISQSDTQSNDLLALRENMSAAQKFNGGSIKQDITVPIDHIPVFFQQADAAMEKLIPGCRPVGFGHFGDGNIHYNISQPIGANKEDFLSQWDNVCLLYTSPSPRDS